MSFADGRKALLQYCSNLDVLCPIEEMTIHDLRPETRDENNRHLPKMVGSVYAIIPHDSVWLFTPGSASRRIPQKEWEIPLPLASVVDYSFYPVADVIAFVEQSCVHYQRNYLSELTPESKRTVDPNPFEDSVEWWTPSCRTVPDNSLPTTRWEYFYYPLYIDNKLQACGGRVGEPEPILFGCLGLEKCSRSARTSVPRLQFNKRYSRT